VAHAGPTYEYSVDDPNVNPVTGNHSGDRAGDITNIKTRYDQGSQSLSWSYEIANKKHKKKGGFWLAVNNGPNPKGLPGELALLYGDVKSGRIWAYEYNGNNNGSSYNSLPGNANPSLLAHFSRSDSSFTANRSNGVTSVSFSIDVSTINGSTPSVDNDWYGIGFGDKIGYWFHVGNERGRGIRWDSSGITDFAIKDGYADKENLVANQVPEPAVLSLLGIGALLMGRRHRKQGARA